MTGATFLQRFGLSGALYTVLAVLAVLVPLLNLLVPESWPIHLSTFMVALLGKYLCYALLALALLAVAVRWLARRWRAHRRRQRYLQALERIERTIDPVQEPAAFAAQISRLIRESIQYGLAHREEALQHALKYARDMDAKLADKFVGMYVNHWTLDYGEHGRAAVRRLLDEGHQAGIIPHATDPEFVS